MERYLAYPTKPQINEFFISPGSFNRIIKVSIPQLIVIEKICLATGTPISEALTLTRSQITDYKYKR